MDLKIRKHLRAAAAYSRLEIVVVLNIASHSLWLHNV